MRATLFSPDHCPGKVVYWSSTHSQQPLAETRNRHVLLAVKLDDQILTGMLDTGTTETTVSTALAKKLFNLKPGDPGVEELGTTLTAGGGKLKTYGAQLQILQFAGLTFRNPRIVISDFKSLDGEQIILGMRQLRQLHLYIAYKERMLYVTPVNQRDGNP
jgi:predicted aspartyl protease